MTGEESVAGDDIAGRVVAGRYRVERELGRGGTSVVYLAHDLTAKPNTDARVALKILGAASDVVSETRLARFKQEAQIALTLRSASFARLIDVGDADLGSYEAPYIAFEFLDGEDLGTRVERAPLRIDQALLVVRQIAPALETLHAAGLVHRDVTPRNVFVCRGTVGDLTVKMLDFGVAKHLLLPAKLTAPGAVVGSPWYMSPEQVRSASDCDARADLWGLAATLYRALTGKRPFEAPSAFAVMMAILEQDPPPPSRHAPELAPLDPFFARAFRKDLGARFQTVGELRDAFEQAVDDVTRPAANPRRRRGRSDVRAMQVVVVVVVLALVGALVALFVSMKSS